MAVGNTVLLIDQLTGGVQLASLMPVSLPCARCCHVVRREGTGDGSPALLSSPLALTHAHTHHTSTPYPLRQFVVLLPASAHSSFTTSTSNQPLMTYRKSHTLALGHMGGNKRRVGGVCWLHG